MKQAIIIGCGYIAGIADDPKASHVLTHAKALKQSQNFELIGCYDTDHEKAEQFAAKWEIPKIFKTQDEIFEHSIDLLVVASSSQSHVDILKMAWAASVKAIVCEKPLATTLEQIEELNQLISSASIPLYTCFPRRFDQSHLKIKEKIQAQDLGDLKLLQSSLRGGLIHNGCHLLDLLRFFFETDLLINPLDMQTIDQDLFGDFQIILKNQAQGMIQVTHALDYSWFELDLMFEKGKFSLKDIGYDLSCYQSEPSAIYPGYSHLKKAQDWPPTLGHALENFYENLSQSKIPWQSQLRDHLDDLKKLISLKNALNQETHHARS